MKKFFIAGLFSILFPLLIMAQQQTIIKKSEIIENISGKQFYMHFIKQGETIVKIAEAYDVQVDDIYLHNPGAKTNIKTGQILKIPFNKSDSSPENRKPEQEQYFLHTVKVKETLYGISKYYGATIEEIKAINPGMSESVKNGETIKIPQKYRKENESSIPKDKNPQKHIVQQGETLYAISRSYNVTVDEIKKANPGLSESLSPGQEIRIPEINDTQTAVPGGNAHPAQQDQVKTHKVVAGETLYSISKLYGVDTDDLKKMNPTAGDVLKTGQILVIPGKSRTVDYIYYTAEKNDKLLTIAQKYGVTYSELVALNPGLEKKISKGQQVKIPMKREEKEKQPPAETTEEVAAIPKPSCDNFKKNMQKTYEVALLLPLYLEQLDSTFYTSSGIDRTSYKDFDPLKFIQFYEGFMMAVDSMKNEGLKMNLHVYDADNSTWKITSLINKPELSNMDLIIGPFFAEPFNQMSQFAAEKKIKIVNPLSTRDEIVNGNPFVFKLKPSLVHQSEQLAKYITSHKSESNIIIIRKNRYKYQEEVSFIKNYLNSHRKTSSSIKNKEILAILDSLKTDKIISDNSIITREKVSGKLNESTYAPNSIKEIIMSEDSSSKLKFSLSRLRENFIVVLSDEKVFCQDLMSRLNKMSETYQITLCGLPEWKKYTDLDNQYLVNLNTHFFVPALVNYSDARITKWIDEFRKRYATEPAMNLYAFDGFDAGWYFLNALFLYGKDFEECLDEIDVKPIQTKFKFEHLKGNGYQNTYWNIGRHNDFKFIPATGY